jgi:hypothetical protein
MPNRVFDYQRPAPPSPLTVDVPCLNCGREPSHPQVRYRFAYVAYWVGADRLLPAQRSYVAALCALCAEAERQAGTTRVRNGFLSRVQQWSAQARNRSQIVRIAEYPEGDPANEREGDGCFRAGALYSYRALSAASALA